MLRSTFKTIPNKTTSKKERFPQQIKRIRILTTVQYVSKVNYFILSTENKEWCSFYVNTVFSAEICVYFMTLLFPFPSVKHNSLNEVVMKGGQTLQERKFVTLFQPPLQKFIHSKMKIERILRLGEFFLLWTIELDFFYLRFSFWLFIWMGILIWNKKII